MYSSDNPLFVHAIVLVLSVPLCGWLIWRFRGRSEKARRWVPRTAGDETVRFFILPTVAIWAFVYGLFFPLTAIGSEMLWSVAVPIFFPLPFVALLMCAVYIILGEYVPVPRWLIPRWSYDPEEGHPFHIKIYKVKRRSDP